jgi:phosphoglycolate phosphatase-like HAD superfamily hydrolase
MMVGDTEDDMQSSLLVGYGLRVAMMTGLTSAERLRAHKPHRVLGCIGEVPLVIDEYHRKGGETAAPLAPIGEDEA